MNSNSLMIANVPGARQEEKGGRRRQAEGRRRGRRCISGLI